MVISGRTRFLELIFILTIFSLKFVSSSVFIRKELVTCDQLLRDPAKPDSGNLTSCSQRLFLSLKLIQDEKLQKKYQFVIVDSAHDVSTKQEVRLLRPLVLKIIQHPATVAYPFKYMFAANNKPYETTLNQKVTSNYTGCDPSNSYQPACQKNEHLAPNRGNNGKVITQGFCCPCENDETKNQRENLVCKDSTALPKDGVDPQATTHCLRFDPVWYSVNLLKQPVFHHKIGIGIYVEDGSSKAERRWKPLLPNYPNFVLGTHHKRAKHEKIVASYVEITSKRTGMNFPLDHKKQLVLIPQPHISNEEYVPPQTKQSPNEFLIVDKDTVDQTGDTCDKIGVSYNAFDKQQNRCHSPLNSCLNNSIQDMWLHDMKQTAKGRKADYFLSSYGNLSDPSVVQEPKSEPLLLFDMEFEHISHVYIDINADLIQTTTQVHGEIIQAVSLSNGKITEIEVHVHNRGLVTAIFTTRMTNCSSPVENLGKHSKAINPDSSATFLSKLKYMGNQMSTDIHTCTAEIFDNRGKKVAERVITFQPLHRCFCIVECSCKCTSQKDWNKCDPISQKESDAAGMAKTLHNKRTGHLKSVASGLLIFIMILLLLFLLGILKCVTNILKSIISSKGNSMYQDIRPDWRQYKLKWICLDIWFFYYCPFWMIYLCIANLVENCTKAKPKKKDLYKGIVKPQQKMSEIFIGLKEDTGKFAVSDSEDEQEVEAVVQQGEPDVSSAAGLIGADGMKTPNQPDKDSNGQQNENNSRRTVPSDLSVTCKHSAENIVAETKSELGDEPARVSSSTSILSKKAIELKFRKQKKHLNNVLKEVSKSDSSRRLGSVTIIASELSQGISEQELFNEAIAQSEPDEDRLSEADAEILKVLTTPARLVYLNESGKTNLLHKSGDFFSLCGTLKKSGLYYKYTLGHNTTQLFWNKKGKIKKLTTPLPISAKNFVKVMTDIQAVNSVTLEPKYPCLNYVTK